MKIIAYCNHCHECFEKWPRWYLKLYKAMIQNMIDHGEVFIFNDMVKYEKIEIMLRRFEKEELIITTECNKVEIKVYPIAIQQIEFIDIQDLDYYHICKDFRTHEPVYVEDNLKEE